MSTKNIMKPEVVKIFEDLEEYREYCRDAFIKFDEADLYKKNSYEYRSFLAYKKGKKTQKV